MSTASTSNLVEFGASYFNVWRTLVHPDCVKEVSSIYGGKPVNQIDDQKLVEHRFKLHVSTHWTALERFGKRFVELLSSEVHKGTIQAFKVCSYGALKSHSKPSTFDPYDPSESIKRLLAGDQVTVYLPYEITAEKTAELVHRIHGWCEDSEVPKGRTAAVCVPLTDFVSLRQDYFAEDMQPCQYVEGKLNPKRAARRINGHTTDVSIIQRIQAEIQESEFCVELRTHLEQKVSGQGVEENEGTK